MHDDEHIISEKKPDDGASSSAAAAAAVFAGASSSDDAMPASSDDESLKQRDDSGPKSKPTKGGQSSSGGKKGGNKGAKQDPVVQSRCIGAAKLGFVVLCVDAFGAGERGVGTALGEYHGEMTAATLLLLGTPLSGMQVYENMRAVDYLLTRPEVDGDKIGITGASGGGNQTERFTEVGRVFDGAR